MVSSIQISHVTENEHPNCQRKEAMMWIFGSFEIHENTFLVKGSGTITIMENYSAKNVSAEVAHFITKLLQ